MAAPGWYRDPGNERLARWFDGRDWTLHTVVMAEWRGRGAPPPPEDRTIHQGSSDAYEPTDGARWAAPAGYEEFAPDAYGEDDLGVPRGPGASPWADRLRDAPPWFRVGAPVLAVLIVLVAVAAAAGSGGGDEEPGGSTTTAPLLLDQAIDAAYEGGFPTSVTGARVGSLLKLACEQVGQDGGVERTAAQLARLELRGDDLSGATDGLADGARALCPDDVGGSAGFFRDVAVAVAADVRPGSTTTSTTRATSTTSSPGTTQRPTTTTRPRTTSTTRPATTTSTPASSTSRPSSTTTSTTPAPTTSGPTTTAA